MSYTITQYTKDRAKNINVNVKPSTNSKKKIDIYYNGKRIAQIGQNGAMDYPSYLIKDGLEHAEERRRLYHLRHKKNTLNELLSLYLLW